MTEDQQDVDPGALARSREYYDRWYAGAPAAPRDFDAYIDLLRPLPARGLWLDVGCGPGFLLRELDAMGGWRGLGVDVSLRALQWAGAGPRQGALAAEGGALPFAEASFDVVSALGTLEHFPSPTLGATEIRRVLKPDGRALIVVPNQRFLLWSLKGRAGTEQKHNLELLLDEPGWRALLAGAGLEVSAVAKDPWHTKPAPAPIRAVRRMANALIPLGRNYQFAFLCRAGTVVRSRRRD